MEKVLKIFGSLISLAAGIAGAKIVDAIWEKTTGDGPPKGTDALENTLRSTLVFALVSGAVRTLIQVLTNRETQKAIDRFARTRGQV